MMSTFELNRRSSVGVCLTDTLDEMVSTGISSPELACQVLILSDESMVEALETQVENKISIKIKFAIQAIMESKKSNNYVKTSARY